MSSIGPSRHPCRILVVEDYPDMSEALSVLLRSAGHAVAVAHDAQTALVTARHFRPHIVLSDVGLPGEMDGYGLASCLRSEADLKGCYLVALTAYAYPTDVERARRAGFEEHVAKPASADLVLEVIERGRAVVEKRSASSGSGSAASPGPKGRSVET